MKFFDETPNEKYLHTTPDLQGLSDLVLSSSLFGIVEVFVGNRLKMKSQMNLPNW